MSDKVSEPMRWAMAIGPSGKIYEIVESPSGEIPLMLPPCSSSDLPVWISVVEAKALDKAKERIAWFENRLDGWKQSYHAELREKKEAVEENSRLKALLKEAAYWLSEVNKFGLSHFEDCSNSNYDDNACDCGMEKLHTHIYQCVAKLKAEVGNE